jgi:DNA-binding NtrC family response regulator
MPLTPDLDSPVLRRVTIPVQANRIDGPATGASIAIVTEDTELASACARVLSREGYVVHTALHSGHAMLACLRGQRIDVLISEMSMEEGSGPALTRRMRRHNAALRAIYLAPAGSLCDADNMLVRPFTREELLSAVARRLSTASLP